MKPPVYDQNWPEEVKALYRHDMQEMWDKTVAPHIWNQYHNQLDIYLSLTGGERGLDILDIGCAQGTLALLLAERGQRVRAMDIRRQFLDYAATRYEKGDIGFICGNALEIDIQERFDLIFANQVIEHLVYPLDFIRRTASWLKPGGRLVVTTPNADYLMTDLPTFGELGDAGRFEHLQFSADGDGHFFAYNGAELEALMTQAGLIRVEARYFESPWISGHMKVRHLHRLAPANFLRGLDSATLCIPCLGRKLAHQLMVTGSMP